MRQSEIIWQLTLNHDTKKWNIFKFAAVPGWSSRHSALSCKQILEAGVSKGDGEYWINSEKNGSSLKVFCDMTTDGGKHFK